jgi:hypothetical protein
MDAIAWAIDSHFALGPAIDGADFLTFGRAITVGAALVTDWTNVSVSHSSLLHEKFALR